MKHLLTKWKLILFLFLLILLPTLIIIGDSTAPVSLEQIYPDPASYMKNNEIIVASDLRLFTTMALFNSVFDYDTENGEQMLPLRAKVRAELAQRLAQVPEEQIAKWKKFYTRHNRMHMYYYIRYTMSLSGQYPFKPVLPESDDFWLRLKYRFSGLKNFNQIMNEFWVATNLETLWQEVAPEYQAEVAKFNIDRIAREEDLVWQYLEMEKSQTGKYLISVPNLLDTHYSAFAIEHDDYFFAVSSPGSHEYGLNIHEYLHGAIGPLIKKHYKPFEDKLRPYFEAAREYDVIKHNYNSLETFVEENLVRAMDARIRGQSGLADPKKMRQQVDTQQAEGFTLILPFYHFLEEYEQNKYYIPFDKGINQIFEILAYYPTK